MSLKYYILKLTKDNNVVFDEFFNGSRQSQRFISLNNDKSINDDKDEDRNTSFTPYNENVKPDNADNDVNVNNNGLNVI